MHGIVVVVFLKKKLIALLYVSTHKHPYKECFSRK